ncbi:MAG: CotH kinase family protein [Bacteroidales bacterium]|nr:CotH kinase family protein [Bacteroidales bacterium]
MNYNRIRGIVFAAFISGLSITLHAQINFPFNSAYKYLKGSQAAALADNWMSADFVDTAWNTGAAPFRYGDGTGGTELDDMANQYSTLYLRTKFTAVSTAFLKTISFTVDYDDGFILWVNGKEVFSRTAPADPAYNAFATENHESGTAVTIPVDSADVDLIDGDNMLSIQGFNVSLTSSDFCFDLQITATPSLPEASDSLRVDFSQKAGFYDAPFDLVLTSPDTSLNILYTIDGSNPQNSITAIMTGDTATLLIDPADTTGRASTPAYMVRASLTKPGFLPTKPVTQTYIFIDKVKTQQHPGGSWPAATVNNQVIDLAMDPKVVNDAQYTDLIDDALLEIPSISIVTDMENLFDPASGIYVNAGGRGLDWEKFTSVELIYPDGSDGFQINAGLRIRGGYSRDGSYPKHAFRFFFRSEYGVPKLYYPLFGDEGVSEFDKMDLRCAQNYSWANWGGEHNTLVRDIFSRDTQRDMHQPYTRGRYYHLYLNGMYWGIYQTEERAEARYASDYFEGSRDDFDVIKTTAISLPYRIEAPDGNNASWMQIYSMCQTGFADNQAYFKLLGKDSNGRALPGGNAYVDIDNFIDYMLVIFYTGNFDAPVSAFNNNAMPNNFYAIDNRNEKTPGFVFLCHDSEHSMMVDPVSPGIGINENRVTISNMTVTSFSQFHPQWLHSKLAVNKEYQARFADRAALHMTGQGALTPGVALERFNKRASEIDTAIIAESARWGDTRTSTPYTKDNAWLPEINKIRSGFFPVRTNIVLNQLKVAKLYSWLNPPTVSHEESELTLGQYRLTNPMEITMKNPNTTGELYYTMDGSDPRLAGGSLSGAATRAGGTTTLTITASAVLKARIYREDGTWSPLKHIDFYASGDDLSMLKVTELNYHPRDVINGTDTTEGKSFEFIEFKNTDSTGALNVSGLVIDSAVYYRFPESAILAPGQFWVIATRPTYFYEMYGKVPSGNCENFFDNAGEYVLLTDSAGQEILSFTYDDHLPWPEEADGDGYTLTSVERNPTGDPDYFGYWTISTTLNGSPFSDDYQYSAIDITELALNHDFLVYPNPSSGMVMIRVNTDNAVTGIQYRVKLYTLNGTLVYESIIADMAMINLNRLGIQPGMIIVKLESDKDIHTEKLIYQP